MDVTRQRKKEIQPRIRVSGSLAFISAVRECQFVDSVRTEFLEQ